MTSNLGMGGNNAIESATVLANQLHGIMKKANGSSPSSAEISEAFAAYQQIRRGRSKFSVAFTGDYTRKAAWSTWFGWVFNRYLAPFLGDRRAIAWFFSPWIKGGRTLDFVDAKPRQAAKVPWTYS